MPRSINESPWALYEPKPDDAWDRRKVAHLHRRAGFGATRAELLRDVTAGLDASVERLFHPPASPPEELEALDGLRRRHGHRQISTCLRSAGSIASSADLTRSARS